MGIPTLATSLPGGTSPVPLLYNVVISNVPGPRTTMYLNGARLDGYYPVSIPTDGTALNMTVLSYDGHMEFGLTGCRRSVPHLQHLLGYLEDSLVELENGQRP